MESIWAVHIARAGVNSKPVLIDSSNLLHWKVLESVVSHPSICPWLVRDISESLKTQLAKESVDLFRWSGQVICRLFSYCVFPHHLQKSSVCAHIAAFVNQERWAYDLLVKYQKYRLTFRKLSYSMQHLDRRINVEQKRRKYRIKTGTEKQRTEGRSPSTYSVSLLKPDWAPCR